MMPEHGRSVRWGVAMVVVVLVTAACTGTPGTVRQASVGNMAASQAAIDQIALGRHLAVTHGCGDCHGGSANPASPAWLSGARGPDQEFKIGPFTTRPRNITPDNMTGIGRFSERQIFNALRYGLRPGETPDVEITSTVAGQGNHPINPKYLAPPMPWTAFRHLSDEHLWAIAAYLKRGVRPVVNRVADSEGPPDFWASAYTIDKVGPYPVAGYPTAQERAP